MERKEFKEILIREREIAATVKEVANKISEDYKDKNLLLIGILKGAYIFTSDLSRSISIPHKVEFMRAKSYGDGTDSSGDVRIDLDLTLPIRDYDCLVVEDILDTGTTLKALNKILEARSPKSLKLCTLLDKPERRLVDIEADYVGKKVPNEFIVGYGLDYAEQYRYLPYIAVLNEDVYTKKKTL